MSNAENILRKKLVYVARKAYEHRLMIGTWGNLSVRMNKNKILITPSGFEKDLLKPSDLLIADLDGQIIKGKWRPSIEMPMHTYIYRRREDVNAIIHTHSHYAMIFAVKGEVIPPLTIEFASVVGHSIPVTRYVRAGTMEAAEEVVNVLDKGKAILIKNHGVVAVGESIEEAYHVALLVEEEARIYFFLKLLSESIEKLDDKEVGMLHEFYIHSYGQKGKKILLKS
ncbi:MAG: class II aldolase/adducin family protein [Nitrososphaerota archaeon]